MPLSSIRRRPRPRLLASILTVLLFAGCAGSSDASPPHEPVDPAAYAPLRPFYAALADLQAGRRARVAVLQIGDSHTANDGFSGRLRELMQARFGDAGRGMLPPGIPFKYYRPATVTVTADGWRLVRSYASDPGPFGFAGLRDVADGPAEMTITADPGQLTQLSMDFLAQPRGGTVDVETSDGRHASIATAGAATLLHAQAPTTAQTTYVQLHARGNGPVVRTGWTALTGRPGVTWSNLGTIGAQVSLLQRWDPALLALEARELQPALILLAFGTNEGFKDSLDIDGYPADYRDALAILRRAAPDVPVLVVGPVGGVRAAGTGAGEPCPGPLGRDWVVPANLPRVRRIEQDIAAREHLFFWNWADAMGGDCQMVPWSQTDPPMAAPDHVHLFKPGYRQTAEALFGTLMHGYELYSRSARRR